MSKKKKQHPVYIKSDFYAGYMQWSAAESSACAIKRCLESLNLDHIMEGSVLDIGCGDGKLLSALNEAFPYANYFGLTNDPAAKKNNPQADIREGDFEKMPFDDNSMSLVLSSNVFDYAEETNSRLGDFNSNTSRVKPATFKLSDLVAELHRVIDTGGIYIANEGEVEKFFSPENWQLFQNTGFVPLESGFSSLKVFQKAGDNFLFERFKKTLDIPESYDNIVQVVEQNGHLKPIYEMGGEFSFDKALSFFEKPNKNMTVLNELMSGNFKNIQQLIPAVNNLRHIYAADFHVRDDLLNLGELLGNLVMLREGKSPDELNIIPEEYFSRFSDIFRATYSASELTQPSSIGVYHTHPFGRSKGQVGKRDKTLKLPMLIVEFDPKMPGMVDLHLVKDNRTYSVVVDTESKTYTEK